MSEQNHPYLVYLPNGGTLVVHTSKVNRDWAVAQVLMDCGRWKVERIGAVADPDLIGIALAVTAERITDEDAAAIVRTVGTKSLTKRA